MQRVNVRSTMQMLSICIPFLRMSRGSATVLSASAGEKPWPGHTIFNSAMASLNMMVRCAALENAQYQVRINAVAPGYVRSNSRANPEFAKSLNLDENQTILSEAAHNTPLKSQSVQGPVRTSHILTEPLDVATQLLWLSTREASFMNGEVMVLDGGIGLTGADFTQYIHDAEVADQMAQALDQ